MRLLSSAAACVRMFKLCTIQTKFLAYQTGSGEPRFKTILHENCALVPCWERLCLAIQYPQCKCMLWIFSSRFFFYIYFGVLLIIILLLLIYWKCIMSIEYWCAIFMIITTYTTTAKVMIWCCASLHHLWEITLCRFKIAGIVKARKTALSYFLLYGGTKTSN